jgi:signal transduction histidine kinase
MPQSAGRGLSAWPIRRKLIALVTVPIMVIVAAGVWLTGSAVKGLRQAERTRSLAIAALATNEATVALDEELTRTLIALSKPTTATRKTLAQARSATDQRLAELNAQLDEAPGSGWSGDVLMAASSMRLSATQLPTARQRADGGSRAPLVIETSFQSMFTALRNLTGAVSREMSTSTADGRTVDQASLLAALAAAAAAAADERATGTIAENENRLSELQLNGLRKLAVEQDVQLQLAASHATPEQQSDIDAIRMDDGRMKLFRKGLEDLRSTGERQDATAFSAATGQRLRNLDDLVGRIALQAQDTASVGVRNALFGTILLGGFTVLVLLLIFATLAAIARTITGPMRRLRSGAVEVATVRLPQAVRQIEQQGIDATIDLPPVMPPGTVAGPETLEVAHAVDGLTAEAVRLATAQVRLRHALDEAFVSMSRRSQSMVEKQLSIIDELESTEEDPEQLRNLFRLDHLAARMRRYNDNLLVLAGSSVRTRSNTPVPISDVFRAATSEMEQYERVRLQPVSNATIAGPVAGGLIHLLAELLDNAAMYSPPTSPILLTAAFTPGGGLHLEVTDSGVGIPPAELAELNARLAALGTIDTQIPSRMGLFVVGRLAHRGGFEVRLSARASTAGTIAEVLVPATHVVGSPQGSPEVPQQGRIPAPQQRTFGPLSPQGLPMVGRPGPEAAPANPHDPGQRPAAHPPAGPPPLAPATGPGLPRRTDPGWPGADRASGGGPSRRTPGPSTGNLPSRVPGAALSGGPLSTGPLGNRPGGRNGPDFSPFNAFDASSSDRPPAAGPAAGPAAASTSAPESPPAPGASPIGPSSATAAWSAQARAARAAGTPDVPGSGGNPGRPGGSLGDRAAFGPRAGFGTPPDAAPAGSPTGLVPGGPGGPFGLRPGGSRPDPAGPAGPPLPTRTPAASFPQPPPASGSPAAHPPIPTRPARPGLDDASRSQGRPPERPPGEARPAGWPGPQPPAPGDGARDRDSGPSQSLPTRDSGPSQSLPTRPARDSADPFGTAKLFGVEMPDPATAAGLFTPGAKAGAPKTNKTEAWGSPSQHGPSQHGPSQHGPSQHSPSQRGPSQHGADRPKAGTPERIGQDRPAGPSFPTARDTRPGDPDEQTGEGPSGTGSRHGTDLGAPLTGELPALTLNPQPNPSTVKRGTTGSGWTPQATWEGTLPTEEAARSAATGRYTPSDPDAPMIGNLDYADAESAAPIFESMSAWFSDQKPLSPTPATSTAAARPTATGEKPGKLSGTGGDTRGGPTAQSPAAKGKDLTEALPKVPVRPGETVPSATDRPAAAATPVFGKSGPQDASRLIDLRNERPAGAAPPAAAPSASRWASLGDQQWLAANARAAAAPQVAGDTEAGLPRRQPGANLLPSAAAAAPSTPAASAPFPRADADVVRGHLGSFQRGVSSARQSTSHPGTTNTAAASLFRAARTTETDQGHEPDEQGGEK